ncbi:DUF3833 domain-containing protein [Granulosicoccus antarcticus]|uniref:Lipoprotein n=1 Tax=Granulosicoccus antarcticus IMCC3135 TaxID=1192854 RepID=A0A2Z2NR17_9GAMM|nr:DUF3833 domain-containing protein [Granulosicoccus antarcticus]ASJ73783.1 hypothetical protein IMCC3135_18520 [Granulosicoccus antarcticus IMCC3135]
MKFKFGQYLRISVLGILMSALTACSSMQINDIPVTDQPFEVEQYFLGSTRAQGIVFDRGGAPMRYFSVQLEGAWDEATQTLTLEEDFQFDDGEISERTWFITRVAEGHYTGKAADVEGQAVGRSKGNALNWQYTLNIPYKNSTLAVQLNDWMYLQDDVLLNRAVMKKFGFRVGEIFISFDRAS